MSEEKKSPEEYRVLARKYRPQNFEELIGQEALVRTLSNAIESGRIAHAFMLTGVRGVGKTTTARIIAKALNYKGADGKAKPTVGDTSDCDVCRAIAEDRHPDVIEMDAASRTGVDDIREILDGVRYAPTEARYKIYIIDEVHMLSKNAFNALLKTLEEPPAHVKFIFATTEIRKVPITVLSRCQRFDLKRVDVPTLSAHFAKIAEAEGVKADEEAMALIARAADGSVRDGLSLLDQAIALTSDKITVALVQDMLGLADRARNLDLLERALSGNTPEALDIMDELYRAGADPVVLIQDLLDLTHILTKLRAVPAAVEGKHAMAPDQVKRAADIAADLSMPTLGKTWQLLLKGLSEVQGAPNPQSAAEMVIIRLAYAADLPDPRDLIKKLESGGGSVSTSSTPASASTSSPEGAPVAKAVSSNVAYISAAAVPSPMPAPEPVAQPAAITALYSLEDVAVCLEEANEIVLASQVRCNLHLVKFAQGLIEVKVAEDAPKSLTQNLGKVLTQAAGQRWVISVVTHGNAAPTLQQQKEAVQQEERDNILALPVMRDVMAVFPEAKLKEIQTIKEEDN